MRRSRLLIFLTATATLLSGASLFGGAGAGAETASPGVSDESWFSTYRPDNPVVNTCGPPTLGLSTTTTSPQPCGPIQPPIPYDNPQSKNTGHYVVSSAGGNAGDGAATGDTGWAAFAWDLSQYDGVTVTKFVVTFTQGVDRNSRNQGDTYEPGTPAAEIYIQGCNIFEGWGGFPGPNSWDGRPKVESRCVKPAIDGRKFTFDLTSFAQDWIDGKGYGVVLRPGHPDKMTELKPFQITFSGTYDTAAAATPATPTPPKPSPPVVTFEYTPAVEEDFDDDFLEGFDDDLFEDISTTGDDEILAAVPDLDVIPTDEGSPPLPEDVASEATGDSELSAPPRRGTRPISSDTSFPWAILLLLPVVAVAFWGTGTALGPIGDPVPARQGGVSRVLAERHAAHRGSDLHTRNRS